MQFFKTVVGMLSHQFEQDGEKDDKGQPIKATEQPMSEDDFVAYKKKKLFAKFPKLSKAQTELLDKLIEGSEIQVDYTDDRHTEYSLLSEQGDVESLSIGTFLCLKKYGLIKLKYCPAVDIERWS